MDLEKYISILKTLFRVPEYTIVNEKDTIEIKFGKNIYTQNKKELLEIIERVKKKSSNKTILFDENNYEVLIDRQYIFRAVGRAGIKIEDCENAVCYEITYPTDEYIIFFLSHFDEKQIRRLRDVRIGFHSNFGNEDEDEDEVEEKSGEVFELLRLGFRSLVTLNIKAINRTEVQFKKLYDSFRFQISYNKNEVLMNVNDFNELQPMFRGRRASFAIEELVAPKRSYNSELTNQYYMGLSSKLPFVEFISYYHVIEYFFEKVYNDDMIKNLQDKISSPRFSIKREQDIKEIIKYVNKKVRDKNELYDINELEALELVLKKYIIIAELVANLKVSNSRLLDYYKSNEVPFSKGDMVDFYDLANPKIFKKIAARIYKTRNSIIHSKSGDKAIYSPFEDDNDLSKEIPLLRVIAEVIIIETSTLI